MASASAWVAPARPACGSASPPAWMPCPTRRDDGGGGPALLRSLVISDGDAVQATAMPPPSGLGPSPERYCPCCCCCCWCETGQSDGRWAAVSNTGAAAAPPSCEWLCADGGRPVTELKPAAAAAAAAATAAATMSLERGSSGGAPPLPLSLAALTSGERRIGCGGSARRCARCGASLPCAATTRSKPCVCL
eukprot:366316-Chlamydomonas_euryale.AAC.10